MAGNFALVHTLKTKMRNQSIQNYRGYAVRPSAHRLPDGYFSSNLMLQRTDVQAAAALYQFYSLDYFSSEEEAIRYSTHWAHNWIETRGA